MLNQVLLMGRMANDVEIRTTNGGIKVGSFTVAVDRGKKKDGSDAGTDFIRCIAFGNTADRISNWFPKGKMILVNGAIRHTSYQANDGATKYKTEIFVNSFEFCGDKSTNNERASAKEESKPYVPSEDSEEKLPF